MNMCPKHVWKKTWVGRAFLNFVSTTSVGGRVSAEACVRMENLLRGILFSNHGASQKRIDKNGCATRTCRLKVINVSGNEMANSEKASL